MSKLKMNISIPSDVQVPTCPLITDNSVLDAIGNTPLIKIKHLGSEFKHVEITPRRNGKTPADRSSHVPPSR